MQEVSASVKARVQCIKSAVESPLNSHQIRSLKEEEKMRCQKEAFVISMMRGSKVLTPQLKKLYYSVSVELMKEMVAEFQAPSSQVTEESFLNDFVGAYSVFFSRLQEKLAFKSSIKNFLRPTNHNLVVDLIKYLVDFTRDYYAQTLFWRGRSLDSRFRSTDGEPTAERVCLKRATVLGDLRFGLERSDSSTHAGPITAERDGSLRRKKIEDSISRHKVRSSEQVIEDPEKEVPPSHQKSLKQLNPQRQSAASRSLECIYDILDISSLPQARVLNKESPNVDFSIIKLNEWFREQKSRNSNTKQSYQSFCESYGTLSSPGPSERSLDAIDSAALPWTIRLCSEKNGFTALSVGFEPKKTRIFTQGSTSAKFSSLSNITLPSKRNEAHLLPLESSKALEGLRESPRKREPILNSMKVLKASQNFFPSLIKPLQFDGRAPLRESDSDQVCREGSDLGSKKSTIHISESIRPSSEAKNQKLVLMKAHITQSSDSAHIEKDSPLSGFEFEKAPTTLDASRKCNYHTGDSMATSKRIKVPKILSSFKLNLQNQKQRKPTPIETLSNEKGSLKKSRVGSDFLGSIPHSRQSQTKNKHSEEKILEWLQKIKNLKEIERRKLLGIS